MIFSKNSTSWGSFFYDEKEDALRVTVKPEPTNESVEWLKYEFIDQTNTGATLALFWEKLKIPIRIETDYIKLQLESFRRELRSEKSFNPGWQAWNQAATFCVMNNVNLEEGLQWAEMATSGTFIGVKNFTTLYTKAQLLEKLGRTSEAAATIQEALPLGTVQELHIYARQLLQQKKTKEAFAVFEQNYKKQPNNFTTIVGMARGWSALGEYNKALKFVKQALPLAPDKLNKDNLEKCVQLLQEGKDIN